MKVHEITQELLQSKVFYKNDGTLWNVKTRKQTGRSKAGRYLSLDMKSKEIHLRCKTHQAVWILHYGQIPENMVIDHKDGNPLNNKIENLRLANLYQNAANSVGYNKAGLPKGVRKIGNRYIARIKYKNIEQYLGSYDTVEEAKKAYDTKAIELHGEFAKV